MGLLSSVKGKVKKVGQALKKFINTPYLAKLNTIEQDLQRSPTKAALVATGAIAAPAALTSLSTATKAATPAIKAGATAAAPIIKSGASSASRAAGGIGRKVATRFLDKPLQTTGQLGAALVGGSILASSKKARTTAVKLPGELVQFGTNIGTAIDNPSVESVKKIATDSPVLTAAALAGAALVISKAGGTAATIANTKAVKESNDLLRNPTTIPTPVSGMTSGIAKPLEKSALQGESPSAINLKSPKKGGKTTKRTKRKAKVNKCRQFNSCLHTRGCKKNGSATKCYNFY